MKHEAGIIFTRGTRGSGGRWGSSSSPLTIRLIPCFRCVSLKWGAFRRVLRLSANAAFYEMHEPPGTGTRGCRRA
jgi:hypothetical protein